MSCFLGQSSQCTLGIGALVASDDRAVPCTLDFQWFWQPHNPSRTPWNDGQKWTISRGLGGQFSTFGMLGDDAALYGGKYEPWLQANGWDADGGAKQNVIVGFTQDQYGNALASCHVEGFVTGGANGVDSSVGSLTSDAGGYYRLPTPYSTTTSHYVVCYLTGSPDVAGTSVNTLKPTATG